MPWTNRKYEQVINIEIKRNLNPGVTDHVILRDVQNGKLPICFMRGDIILKIKIGKYNDSGIPE